jgi:hypothetical protein
MLKWNGAPLLRDSYLCVDLSGRFVPIKRSEYYANWRG